jgi:menaquinone-9 beta-reductase
MKESQYFDVIVVGAGPGGAAAAKRCSENGLNTLLIEKKQLPRDKVCSGMVMGKWACQIIEDEFGPIPDSVLTDPPVLSGHRFYVGPTETQTLKWPTALSWRKDLDFWMVRGALNSGVIMREGARVFSVTSENGDCRVTLRKETGETEELSSRFVIGADGGTSVVRKSLFPELKVRYSGPIRECYRGALDLEKDIFHWFFPKGLPRPRFNVNHKGDVFLMEGSGLRELRREIGEALSPFGFDPDSKPEWTDGCAIALLHDELLSGAFKPAKQNVLLIGDAAGLILPITFEGIGSALKSGILAAEAVIHHFEGETGAASSLYHENLDPIIKSIRSLCTVQDNLKTASGGGAKILTRALKDAYHKTLTIQET